MNAEYGLLLLLGLLNGERERSEEPQASARNAARSASSPSSAA